MNMLHAPRRLRHALAAGLTLVSLAGAIPALAQDKPKAAPPAAEEWSFGSGPVIVMEHVALDKFFSDPKDKAFGDALAMLPARAAELHNEIPDMPPEATPIIQSMLKVLARPARVTVAYNESPTGGFFGYGIDVSVLTTGKDEADALQTQMTGILEQADNIPPHKASSRFKGMREMQLPFGLIAFGPRTAKDGWRYEIIVGTMDDPDAGASALPAPMKGIEPLVRFHADLAGLTPIADTIQTFAGKNPQFQEARAQFEKSGLIGAKAMTLSYQAGQTASESVSFLTVEGAGRAADAAAKAPLDRADLKAIPSDAYTASLSRSGGGVSKMLDQAKAKSPEVGQMLDQVKQMTGVDLENDLLASFGDVVGFYTSESTGGGGIGSAVLMVSVTDRAKLKTALGKLADFGNTFAADEAHGYVHIAITSDRDNVDLISLRFPGVPVPFEVTAALTDKWLLIAPTVQGAMVAAAQVHGKDGGLTANADFAAVMPKDISVTRIKFNDTPRTVHEGYTLLTMAGAAVANLVRSPTDPTRQPQLTVPIYPEFKKGVKPQISWGYWKGDDYISESHADRSILVNASTSAGTFMAVVPAIAAVAVAAQQHAQEEARHLRNAPEPVKPRRPRHNNKDESEDLISSAGRIGAELFSLYESSQIVPSPEGIVESILARQAFARDGE